MQYNLNFLSKYNHPKNIRFDSFYKSLTIAHSRNLKIFVETGTSRGKKKLFFFKKFNWKDGMSTLMFAEYAKINNGKLYSCDLSKSNINNAKKFTKKFINYVDFIVDDSIHYLSNLNIMIDFLYLDSLDGHDQNISSLHQLNEIKSALDKLHKNSLVLIDDKSSKGILSLKFMLNNNFKILNETNEQVLLSSKS